MYFREDLPYPRPGTGLNHPAMLSFYKVHPKHMKDVKTFIEFLKDETAKMGAEFVSYDEASGEWKIRVKHFSRYGLNLEDNKRSRDDDAAVEAKRVKEVPSPVVQASFQEDTHNLTRVVATTHVSFSVLSLLVSLPRQASLLFQQKSVFDMASSFVGALTPETLVTTAPTVSITPRAGSVHTHSLDALRSAAVYVETSTSLPVPQLQLPQGSELQLLVENLAQVAEEKASGLLWELVRILFVNGESVCACLFTRRNNDFFGQYAWDKNAPFSSASQTPAEQARLKHKRTALGRWLEQAIHSEAYCDDTRQDTRQDIHQDTRQDTRQDIHQDTHQDIHQDDCFSRAVALLFRHDVRAACGVLRESGYDRLAVLVAQISSLGGVGEV